MINTIAFVLLLTTIVSLAEARGFYLKYDREEITNLFIDGVLYDMEDHEVRTNFPYPYDSTVKFEECSRGLFGIRVYHKDDASVMDVSFPGDIFIKHGHVYFRWWGLEGKLRDLWKFRKCLKHVCGDQEDDHHGNDGYEDDHEHGHHGDHWHGHGHWWHDHDENEHDHDENEHDHDENEHDHDENEDCTTVEAVETTEMNIATTEEVVTTTYEVVTTTEEIYATTEPVNYVCSDQDLTTPSQACSGKGYCIGNDFNGYSCSCLSGYIGETCNEYIPNNCSIQGSDLVHNISVLFKGQNYTIKIDVPLETSDPGEDIYSTWTLLELFGGDCVSQVSWEKDILPEECTETYEGSGSIGACYTETCFDSNNIEIACVTSACTSPPCFKQQCNQLVVSRSYVFNDADEISFEETEICSTIPWVRNPGDSQINATFTIIVTGVVQNPVTKLWDITIVTVLSESYKLVAIPGSLATVILDCDFNDVCFQTIIISIDLCVPDADLIAVDIEDVLTIECNSLECIIDQAPDISGVLTFVSLGDCVEVSVDQSDALYFNFNAYSSETYDLTSTTFFETETNWVYFEITGFETSGNDVSMTDLSVTDGESILDQVIFDDSTNAIRFKVEFENLLSNNETKIETAKVSATLALLNTNSKKRAAPQVKYTTITKQLIMLKEGYNDLIDVDTPTTKSAAGWFILIAFIVIIIVAGIIVAYTFRFSLVNPTNEEVIPTEDIISKKFIASNEIV